jgi:uncharacterized membrane protein
MESKKRHIAKTLTWRVLATGTTFLLTLFFFREDPNATEKASSVALAEAILKMVLYYYHERLWYSTKVTVKSSIRHLSKTITWRIIASITTFGLAYFFFKDDPDAMQKASGIAIAETFIKMAIYYVHERAWHSSKFGL